MRVWGRALWVFCLVLASAGIALISYRDSPFFRRLRQSVCRKIRCSLGIKDFYIKGEYAPQAQLIVANHVSYADIIVLGEAIPCRFVSKEDVRQWPIIGWTAERLGTIFISRKSYEVKLGVGKLQEFLQSGKGPIVLFPEATTSDGCHVLPFRSSYFHLPSQIWIQPVSLKYSHVNGLPALRFFEKMLSWRGQVSLVNHLKWALGLRRIGVTLVFHPPLLAQGSRKELASHCFHYVQKGFEQIGA